jgi:hypothetical protein
MASTLRTMAGRQQLVRERSDNESCNRKVGTRTGTTRPLPSLQYQNHSNHGLAPSPLRPSCEGWFEERGQPRSTSSRVPRQGSPSAPFRIEAASPSKRRSQGLSRMSTKVSRPVLRGPGPSNGAWLLGSEYTNARKGREDQRA